MLEFDITKWIPSQGVCSDCRLFVTSQKAAVTTTCAVNWEVASASLTQREAGGSPPGQSVCDHASAFEGAVFIMKVYVERRGHIEEGKCV